MDRVVAEKMIVSTILQDVEEHRQLLLLDAEFFSDGDLRKVYANLQNGVEPLQSYRGSAFKLSDIAFLMVYNTSPNSAYGYADMLREFYIKDKLQQELSNMDNIGESADRIISIFEKVQHKDSEDVKPISFYLTQAGEDVMTAMERVDTIVYSPFANLNSLIGGFVPGRLITIAGRPGTGKSAYALQIAMSIAKRKHKVLYVSLEMLGIELSMRVISNMTGISTTAMANGKVTADQVVRIGSAIDKAAVANLYVTNKGRDLNALSSLIKTHKPELVIVDSLNLMYAKGETERVRIMKITRSLKELTFKFNIPIVMIAQLSRMADEMSLPTMSALKESGSIEEDSDVVILLSELKDEKVFDQLNDSYKQKNGEYLMSPINGFKEMERFGSKLILGSVAKNRNGATGKVVYECESKNYNYIELPIQYETLT
jgi:replicative DNA helicase